ncbi:MAG: site-specific integrase [Eubacteriales bacterium]|nr:site-specific integrase [Eubacteriales bacterium]
MKMTQKMIEDYRKFLFDEEKASATVEKYVRDVTAFMKWANNKSIEKQIVLEYKNYLIQNYAIVSVNSVLSSLNSFFSYMEWHFLRVKTVKVQRNLFSKKERVACVNRAA